jgi:hypothetical protein
MGTHHPIHAAPIEIGLGGPVHGLFRGAAVPDGARCQQHGLDLRHLGGGLFYAWCHLHECPSEPALLWQALEADCPGCRAVTQAVADGIARGGEGCTLAAVATALRRAQPEIELRRIVFRLRVGSV